MFLGPKCIVIIPDSKFRAPIVLDVSFNTCRDGMKNLKKHHRLIGQVFGNIMILILKYLNMIC